MNSPINLAVNWLCRLSSISNVHCNFFNTCTTTAYEAELPVSAQMKEKL